MIKVEKTDEVPAFVEETVATAAPASPKVVEMMDLFELDGKTYQIPARPRVNLALKFLYKARTEGMEMAAAMLLVDLIGEEGFQALMDCDELEPDQLATIINAAQKVTMGGLEKALGESGAGQAK
jgi:hypothetical protein